jgi:hypothetical protein
VQAGSLLLPAHEHKCQQEIAAIWSATVGNSGTAISGVRDEVQVCCRDIE